MWVSGMVGVTLVKRTACLGWFRPISTHFEVVLASSIASLAGGHNLPHTVTPMPTHQWHFPTITSPLVAFGVSTLPRPQMPFPSSQQRPSSKPASFSFFACVAAPSWAPRRRDKPWGVLVTQVGAGQITKDKGLVTTSYYSYCAASKTPKLRSRCYLLPIWTQCMKEMPDKEPMFSTVESEKQAANFRRGAT